MANLTTASLTQYNRQLLQTYTSNAASASAQDQAKTLLQNSVNQSVSQQRQDLKLNTSNNFAPNGTAEQAQESVKVSSSIGKAAAKGQLTREEALAIYEKIASFL